MKSRDKLKFGFKGNRKYVQGPDIFDAAIRLIEEKYGKLENVKYSAHNWLHKSADLVIGEDIKEYNSKIDFNNTESRFTGYIIDNGESITETSEYSEDYIINNSIIKDSIIALNMGSELTLTETLVSMNKHFLQSLGFTGKWIVTKIEYENWSEMTSMKGDSLRLELIKNLKNRLTKSFIFLNNNKIGTIYFSLI